jgi:hypothetical protein
MIPKPRPKPRTQNQQLTPQKIPILKCSNWNIHAIVRTGTFAHTTVKTASMFQLEHSTNMFPPEHSADSRQP